MAFFEGALNYKDIERMPLSKFIRLQGIAEEISKEREAEIERSRRGK